MPGPNRKRGPTPADLPRYVGERVRYFRELRGMSQSSLAAAAGLPEATISRIETFKSNTELRTLSKVALGLRVRPSELLP